MRGHKYQYYVDRKETSQVSFLVDLNDKQIEKKRKEYAENHGVSAMGVAMVKIDNGVR